MQAVKGLEAIAAKDRTCTDGSQDRGPFLNQAYLNGASAAIALSNRGTRQMQRTPEARETLIELQAKMLGVTPT